jgi:hypothetical protein
MLRMCETVRQALAVNNVYTTDIKNLMISGVVPELKPNDTAVVQRRARIIRCFY